MPIPLQQFISELADSGIVDFETLRDALPPKSNPKDAQDLAVALVRQKKLTRYQAEEIYRGKGRSLVLGNYTILDKIGAGGMGQVFKARHRHMHRIVAVKMLSPEMQWDAGAVARFEREVAAAAQLNHPNIVTAHDADQVNGIHLLVMEYIDGKDLHATVKQEGPLSVEQAVNCILHAARGLEAAHAAGIVHRDVKPANLLLDKKGTVKILDLGLAHLGAYTDSIQPTDLTEKGNLLGTIDYMSPEQAVDTRSADARTDIYSLGCTLYFLLTGRPVYGGETRMARVLAHRESPIPSLQAARPEVSQQLETLFRTMVAKDVRQRIQSIAEVIAVLEPLADGAKSNFSTRHSDAPLDAGLMDALQAISDLPSQGQADRNQKHASLRSRRILIFGGLALSVIVLAALVAGLQTKKTNTPTTHDRVESLAQELIIQEADSAKTPAPRPEDFDRWLADVAVLPPDEQVSAVAKKLQEYNPGFDGHVKPQIEGVAVTSLEFTAHQLTDISPLKALRQLRGFFYFRTPGKIGELTDLSPLARLPLENVYCGLTELFDLSPLRGMRLTYLNIGVTRVKDLTPLQGMPLRTLDFGATPVSDLSPLRGMPLEYLNCRMTRVTDLSPLTGMPLKILRCDFVAERDAGILHAIKTLEMINELPADEFWAAVKTRPSGERQ